MKLHAYCAKHILILENGNYNFFKYSRMHSLSHEYVVIVHTESEYEYKKLPNCMHVAQNAFEF